MQIAREASSSVCRRYLREEGVGGGRGGSLCTFVWIAMHGWGQSADPRLQIQIAARGGEGSCGAEDRSADLRLQIQIAARGGEGRCRAEDRSADLRLQIQIAARDGEGRCRGTEARSADPRLQIQIAAHSREGGCRDRDEV